MSTYGLSTYLLTNNALYRAAPESDIGNTMDDIERESIHTGIFIEFHRITADLNPFVVVSVRTRVLRITP